MSAHMRPYHVVTEAEKCCHCLFLHNNAHAVVAERTTFSGQHWQSVRPRSPIDDSVSSLQRALVGGKLATVYDRK